MNDVYLNDLKNSVNVANVNNIADKLFSYLFDHVNTTELGTRIGEELSNNFIVSKNNAITLMNMIIRNDHKQNMSLSNGLQADLDYRKGIIDSNQQYYAMNGNGLPQGLAPFDVNNIIDDIFEIEKHVKNY